MKRILFTAMVAAMLQGCASDPVIQATHETTTIDRELALKLVDKAGRIEIVQTNNGTASQVAAHGPWEKFQPAAEADTDDRQQCIESPRYSTAGVFLGTQRRCFGGR